MIYVCIYGPGSIVSSLTYIRYMTRKTKLFPQTTVWKIRIFSRGQSADSARTLRGFRTDNQRIPCGTISKFYSYNDISNDPCGVFLDPLELLRMKFAFWFPPFSNRIRTEDSCPSVRKIRACPCGSSAAPVQKIRVVLRGTTTEFLGKSSVFRVMYHKSLYNMLRLILTDWCMAVSVFACISPSG